VGGDLICKARSWEAQTQQLGCARTGMEGDEGTEIPKWCQGPVMGKGVPPDGSGQARSGFWEISLTVLAWGWLAGDRGGVKVDASVDFRKLKYL